MSYCRNCGQEVHYKAENCPNCGESQREVSSTGGNSGACGYNLLGFFVPIAGIVLYFVWKDEKPYEAEAAGLGAIVNIVIGFVYMLFAILLSL